MRHARRQHRRDHQVVLGQRRLLQQDVERACQVNQPFLTAETTKDRGSTHLHVSHVSRDQPRSREQSAARLADSWWHKSPVFHVRDVVDDCVFVDRISNQHLRPQINTAHNAQVSILRHATTSSSTPVAVTHHRSTTGQMSFESAPLCACKMSVQRTRLTMRHGAQTSPASPCEKNVSAPAHTADSEPAPGSCP